MHGFQFFLLLTNRGNNQKFDNNGDFALRVLYEMDQDKFITYANFTFSFSQAKKLDNHTNIK